MVVMAVNMTGRNRVSPVCTRASRYESPLCMSLL